MPTEVEDKVTGQEADAPPAPQGRVFTEEEVNKLLEREKNKLYGRIEKSNSLLDELKGTVSELQKESKERAAAEAKARKEAEALAKQKAEAEMSAKELIEAKTRELQEQQQRLQDEWAQRYTGLEQQIETERAIFAKEKAMNDLAMYTQQAVAAAADEIAPELVRFISGSTKEEVDAQIAQAKEATQSILAGIQQAQVAQRAAMPGVSPTGFAPTGPLDTQDTTRELSAADIQNMSMAEYQKMRAQLGTAGAGMGKGLFG